MDLQLCGDLESAAGLESRGDGRHAEGGHGGERRDDHAHRGRTGVHRPVEEGKALIAALLDQFAHALERQGRQFGVALGMAGDDVFGLSRGEGAQDGQAAGAHTQRAPHPHIEGERLDRVVSQCPCRAHRLVAAPLAQVDRVLREFGQRCQRVFAALGQLKTRLCQQSELVDQGAEQVFACHRMALEHALAFQALQHAKAGGTGQAAGSGDVTQAHAAAAPGGNDAQQVDDPLDALRAVGVDAGVHTGIDTGIHTDICGPRPPAARLPS